MSLPDSAAVRAEIARFETELAQASSAHDAQVIHDRFLGRRHSVVASWMQTIGSAPPDQKREIGRLANELKQAVEERWRAYEAAAISTEQPRGGVDVTLPGRELALGHRHPLTIVRDRLEEVFTRMGFAVVEGPEVEDEWHCFDALNMSAEHPARDMQDTLYLATSIAGDSPDDRRTLLRTHTSSMQIRYMRAHKPPIRIVVPGRVYRRDDLDLTHSPAFEQLEGLAVGEGLSLADLKGTLLAFARQMFSPRWRCSSGRVSFRTQNRALRSTSAAGNATAAAARCARRPDGSSSEAAAWCIPPSSKPSVTTLNGIQGSRGASASNGSRSYGTALRTSDCSTRMT